MVERAPEERKAQQLEELLRRLDERLADVHHFIVSVAGEVEVLRGSSEHLARELTKVSGRIGDLRGGGAHDRCPECGSAVTYEEAVGGWSTSCRLCHWSDFRMDPAHASPPSNVTYASRAILGAQR